MTFPGAGRLAALAAVVALVAGSGVARAETPAAPQSYKDAQYVQVTLGDPNQELGIRLVDGQPDGLTKGAPSGRISLANPVGPERYFYFDVHDTYVRGGKNAVIMTVTYRDVGLTPVWLEYDAYDPYRPNSLADDVAKKRVVLFTRANTEAMRTARIQLDDARFLNSQPGGADLRIGSADDLVLANVSVMLLTHEEPAQPIRVVLDGRPVAFDPNDVQPFIHPVTGRTLVPFRAMFHALGIKDTAIGWDGQARRVDAQRGMTFMSLTIDSDYAIVNAVPVKLDQPAIIIGGRTVVPLRFVTEQFGLDVAWAAATRVITLTTRPPVPPAPSTPPTVGPTAPPTPPTAPSPQQKP
ncbi:MAG TPA: copper amine oxidase N-terminal domain-containing protein [Symbiobacteriaceae bacterium]|jgi:hypothetical protein